MQSLKTQKITKTRPVFVIFLTVCLLQGVGCYKTLCQMHGFARIDPIQHAVGIQKDRN